MYDAESLIGYLEADGFHEVAQMEFCRSAIPGIEEVERPDRVLNVAGVCIEGKRIDD
jgi:hypothetical protein